MKAIESLVGQTIKNIRFDDISYIREIYFEMENGIVYKMYHEQDCCEEVSLEDCCGDWDDLIGLPVISAEEAQSDDEDATESGTWTFYKIDTARGGVVLRWYGSSNGYYSEDVCFTQVVFR